MMTTVLLSSMAAPRSAKPDGGSSGAVPVSGHGLEGSRHLELDGSPEGVADGQAD